jgi:Zn-dependent protease
MQIPASVAHLLQQVSVLALPAIFAITFHEAAHGFVAWRCGDDTALQAGRVTFNPLKHIDPFGTVVMPLILFLVSGGQFLFGYAKPVPVAFHRLRHPRRDMVWVALAGPGINIALAVVSALLMYVADYAPDSVREWLFLNLQYSVMINVILAVFNMIPLPPLDGGRVAVGILPDALAIPLARMERVGMLVLIGLLFLVPMVGQHLGMDWNIVGRVVEGPVSWVLSAIGWLTGIRVT